MKNTIIGAVAGDVIGSIYEFHNIRTIVFPLLNEKCNFTDDSVLTIAVADCILHHKDFSKTIWDYAKKYPHRGYGGGFMHWIAKGDLKPYNSFGNGSAMRVSPVGFAYNDIDTVLHVAKQSAEVTHNHPEGIKGAQAIASAIFYARMGKSKEFIKDYISTAFHYNLNDTVENLRKTSHFDETCQGSATQAIIAFLESTDFENAIRLAVSIGGDSDTIACMTGGIAAAFYREIPDEIIQFVSKKLPKEFNDLIKEFDEKYS